MKEIHLVNSEYKMSYVAILISDKADIKMKHLLQQERFFTMIKAQNFIRKAI